MNTVENYTQEKVLLTHPTLEDYCIENKMYGNNNTEEYHAFVKEHEISVQNALKNPMYEYDINQENSWYCFWDVCVLAAVCHLFRRECMRPIEVSTSRMLYLMKEIDQENKAIVDAALQWTHRYDLHGSSAAETLAFMEKEKKEDIVKAIQKVLMHDPYKYITIASYSFSKAMRQDLPKETFHVVREVSLQNQSQMAFQAASWIEYKHGYNFTRHAYDVEGELEITSEQGRKYKLDFVDLFYKVVFEFNGCRYHPCDDCKGLFHREKDFEFEKTEEKRKEEAIKKAGFSLLTMKSCEFMKLKKEIAEDALFEDYLATHERFPPMKARDGCIGGSVNARTLYMNLDKINQRYAEEKIPLIEIDYSDGTSLYPSQMVYGFFCGGMPTKFHLPLLENMMYDGKDPISSQVFDYIDPFVGKVVQGVYPYFQPGMLKFGRYMVRILAPEAIRDPLLKLGVVDQLTKVKKLMPVRCYECCKSKHCRSDQLCDHDGLRRSFVGTFMSVELNKALQIGYQIIQIHHAELYTPIQGVFANYMRNVFKLKLLSSGRKELMEKYKTFENLQKEAWRQNKIWIENEDEIPKEKNPALRQTAKIQINSPYGKFAQQPITEYQENFSSFEQLYEFLDKKEEEFSNWHVTVIGSILSFEGETDEGYAKDNFKLNPLISSFVTAYGRVDLYSKKEAVGIDNVLYEDTDSVVYLRPQGSNPVFEDSDWLGGWKRELKRPVLGEFLSLGPKTKYFRECDLVDEKTRQVIKKGEEHFSFKGFKSTKDFYDKMITNGGMKNLLFSSFEVITDAVAQSVTRSISLTEVFIGNEHDEFCVPGIEIDNIQLFEKQRGGHIITTLTNKKVVKVTNDKSMMYVPPGYLPGEIISTTPW